MKQILFCDWETFPDVSIAAYCLSRRGKRRLLW